MRIEVYGKGGDSTFLVRISDSVYEMSRDANMPNGVNLYAGYVTELRDTLNSMVSVPLHECSHGMLLSIARRVRDDEDRLFPAPLPCGSVV